MTITALPFLIKKALNIYKDKKLVLKGYGIFTYGLWDVRFPNKTQTIQYLKQKTTPSMNYHINAIIRKNTSNLELAQYLHASCGSPAITTF